MAKSKIEKVRKKEHHKASLPTKFLLFVNFVFILLLILSLLASHISPAKFWPLAFAGISYPLFLLINLFFVLFWLVFLKKYFVFSLLAIALGYNHFNSFIQLRSTSESIVTGNVLKVMSYNVRLFGLYDWKNQKQNSEARENMFSLIRSESPDILCMQEYYSGRRTSVNYADTIIGFGNSKYYYAEFIDNGRKKLPFGLVTFSKYPIIHTEKINYLHSYENYCLISDIAMPDDTVRVLNTHLESIKFGKEDYVFVNDIANNSANNKIIKQGSKVILSKMLAAYKKRASQADQLADIIDRSPYPVILCADFNDTPASYAYHQIAQKSKDSFLEAGSGFGQTYTQFLPILRIDYIFTSDRMKVIDYKTIHKDYSDHYPIIARIVTKGT